ncbi:MAG: phosphoribosyltransferase [Promethearchaeota archaeon]|nr:MAG: phosphoribosyltransferase [Candidatus Lokiarchaeota archaeon]
MKYENRKKAGKVLANKIRKEIPKPIKEFIILAIPRGGVPVAFSVAKELDIPFNLVITKKLAHPNNPEVAIGAIAADGTYEINERILYYGVDQENLDKLKNNALEKVETRIKKYSKGKQLDVKNKNIFVIDDGIATGYTALVAGKYLKNLGAKKVILAIPVCPESSIEKVKKVYDELICPSIIKSYSFAVGSYYDDFHQNTDEELFDFIKKAKKNNLFYE